LNSRRTGLPLIARLSFPIFDLRSAGFGRNHTVEIGSCESGELSFAFAFLFTASFLAKAAKSGLRRKTKPKGTGQAEAS